MLDNSKNAHPQIRDLVNGICKFAGSRSDSERELALHSLLRHAYEVEEVLNQQEEHIAYLDHLAMTDPLTALLNRRGFEVELDKVLASAQRYEESGVLAYIDLDDFKEINDTCGHACGDHVLRHTATILQQMTRNMDYIARLGGDEFAVLLVRSGWDNGQVRIEKIAKELNGTPLTWEGHALKLHASVGMQYYDQRSNAHDLLHAADEAMYEIKKFKLSQKQEECPRTAAE